MSKPNSVRRAVRYALFTSAATALGGAPAIAQDEGLEEVVVTGTRIVQPGVVSSSPIYSIGADEIALQQQPELEKILRILPSTVPDDGPNINNGTDGASTIDLRGLGSQRTLVMINGKRAVPYNYNGLIDTSMIPTALIERVDIITGGASAVYGSDAISGAVNIILKDDFEGAAVDATYSQTGESDGDTTNVSLTLGTNAADNRGNVVMSFNYQERDPILLGARPLGLYGIGTDNAANYAEFLAGEPPAPAEAGCDGSGSVAIGGGSTTTVPTRVAIAGGPALGQFRNDGTLGSDCSEFNFNPFNYYQTPLERYGATVMGSLEFSEHAEVYAMFNYGKTSVVQQVAASGIFGNGFFTPLANPLIGAQARQTILDAANAGVAAGTVNVAGVPDPSDPTLTLFHNWNDNNGNGVVDTEDDLNIQYRRRTVEFGDRTEDYNNELWQVTVGTRGALVGDWDYDVSFQYGETNRILARAGYTNVSNTEAALQTTDGVTCANGDPTCVPINMFGGLGAITPEMAAYSSATALQQQDYSQLIATAFVTGPIDFLKSPLASNPVAVSIGAEYRDEYGETVPDECLKLAPASCLGGAGGNLLPIAGGFDVREGFAEALIPLVEGVPFVHGLDVELGYRYSDYDPTGSDDTWKAGLNWRPIDSLMFRVMQQKATRAPNVGELAFPQVTGLDNAQLDPCSINNAGNITAELQALCQSTGMSAAQVGTVEDIVSNQVNGFFGTDLENLPEPETADTTTIGVVWTPDFLNGAVFSLDYYDIDIEDVIGEFTGQEILDACYVAGLPEECAKVRRIGGTLTLPGAGIELFTTNKVFLRAEGVELGFAFGFELGGFGDLQFSGNVNKYLTHEFQSGVATPVVDCNGLYGTSCQKPRPELRWIQRTTWNWNNLTVSAMWRHIDSVDAQPDEIDSFADPFKSIDSFDYIDLYASYQLFDMVTVSLGVVNVFDEDPPVVGDSAGSTTFNSGNTFPAMYDTLGQVITVGLSAQF